MRRAVAVAAVTISLALSASVRAEPVTACAANGFCYCVSKDLQDAVERNIARIKERLAKERALGKAIGYLSIPLSTIGGSYMGVNTKVAELATKGIEERFGLGSVWMLNPGSKDYALPDDARGTEYMLMWTKVLEGESGLGQDFDFVYFTGPSDFARFFSLRGRSDMRKIEEYYDRHAKSDPELRKIDKAMFRNYYALRASVSFSYGSHDEWNIVRAINQKRRDANEKSGLPAQLGVIFDGHAAAPGLFDTEVSAGNARSCRSGSN